ncbi:uncharacterized protein DS421_15g498340 [Arachis hypogaea]|nr:uncharacterized protein DS421_15g498340 [Arachis hypogaea]
MYTKKKLSKVIISPSYMVDIFIIRKSHSFQLRFIKRKVSNFKNTIFFINW